MFDINQKLLLGQIDLQMLSCICIQMGHFMSTYASNNDLIGLVFFEDGRTSPSLTSPSHHLTISPSHPPLYHRLDHLPDPQLSSQA
jgi:hypothetical protein